MKGSEARRTRPSVALCALLGAASALAQSPPQPSAAGAPAEDGSWRMPGKNAASTRFSGLDEINNSNVAQLQVEFTFSNGALRGTKLLQSFTTARCMS